MSPHNNKQPHNQQMDYETRARQYGFAPPEQVLQALGDEEHTHVLDVRSAQEIAVTGKIRHKNWRMSECTRTACPALAANAQAILAPNGNNNNNNNNNNDKKKDDDKTVIVIYCASGRRATRAKEILLSQGYKTVLNAGGYEDVMRQLSLQQKQTE